MKILLVPLLVFSCVGANAEVFKRIGPDGKTYFSDQPGPDAQAVEVAPAQTISLPPVSESTETASEPETAADVYTALTIVSPGNEQEIRANDGNVAVQLSLQPALRPGHSVKLIIDGQDGEALKTDTGMSVTLNNLSRGRHTLVARVVDSSGKLMIESDTVGFHVLRAAVGR